MEPAEGSDGTDGRWRIACKVAEDRDISTVDPEARHTRKSPEARRDGPTSNEPVCRSRTTCQDLAAGAAVHLGVAFGVAREKTKVRVNGVVDDTVARLEYRSAPGGAPRVIPLVEIHPGQRVFSFRSANMSHGRLVAYGADGRVLATYTDELP